MIFEKIRRQTIIETDAAFETFLVIKFIVVFFVY